MCASTKPARIVPLPAMTIFLPIVEARNVRDAPMNPSSLTVDREPEESNYPGLPRTSARLQRDI